jgi:hypothetical protein
MAAKEVSTRIDFSDVYDEDKFRELVLYIADKCSDDPDFGATKLNKILFYSEFFSYGRYGKSITKMPYFRLKNGPAPKFLKVISEKMVDDCEIAIQPKPRFGFTQLRTVPLREADLRKLDAPDVAIVDEVISALCGMNATSVSKYSHLEIGVRMVEEKEEIPYNTVFLSRLPLSEYDIEHGLELAKQYAWAI